MGVHEGDNNHPVLIKPWEYAIIGLNYQIPRDGTSPYLDLTLQRKEEVRRLRFLSPQRLKIEEGFPTSTHGMEILDIAHRQWSNIGVWVHDFEASQGSITFYAAEVIDLDAQR